MLDRSGRQLTLLRTLVLAAGLGCRDSSIAPVERYEQVLWRVASGPPTDGTPHDPVANGDRSMIYFVTPDYRLKKIRGSDGQVMFDVPVGAPIRTFPQWNSVLSADVVAVAKVDVMSFDTTSGAPRWSYVPADGEETGYSPLVANDSTVFAAGRGRVHAIDARTGSARWIADLSGSAANPGAFNPSLLGDELYVCTKDFDAPPPTRGTLWSLDATTGTIRWSYRFEPELPEQSASCYGSAAFWQGLVIQPQEDGRVFAFHRSDGEIMWIAPRVHDVARSLGDRRWASVAGNTLLVTSVANRGMIVGHDAATGRERWRATDNGGSLYPPAIDDGTAFVDHGWIFASYELATGKLRWQTPKNTLEAATVFKGRPIIAADRIFVAGRDASYALRR